MEKQKTLRVLSESVLFHGLKTDEIEGLLLNVKYKILRYKRNEIYTLEGMNCCHVDLVLSGCVTAYMVGDSGKSLLMGKIGAGAVIAPAFVYAKSHKMPVTVKADANTEVLRMSPGELLRFIDGNATVRHNFIVCISEVVVYLTQKIHMLNLMTARQKVVSYLKELCRQQGGNIVDLGCSRQELADSFGIQKYSLARILSELAGQGIITVEGRRITIRDMQALRRL